MSAVPPDSTAELTITARTRDLGGFEVGRVLPSPQRRMVGPFIFFDHLGPRTLTAPVPRATDVRPHPHIGLATVTYLFEGELTHRDSLGVEQVIRPGEVNWMTAGRGISHSERFDGMRSRGGLIHGLQAWIALPDGSEETEPAFEHYDSEELATVDLPGAHARLIAGSAFGAVSGVKTRSPLFYAHVELEAGASIAVPGGYPERAAYVVDGAVVANGRRLERQTMIVFAEAAPARVEAATRSVLMLLGGAPIGERHIWWNFVSSRPERIEQAKADWAGGRFTLPPADRDEWIPLPTGP